MRVTVLSADGQVVHDRQQIEDMAVREASRLIATGCGPGSRLAVTGDTCLGSVVLARAALVAGFQISFLGRTDGPGGVAAAVQERLRGLAPAKVIDARRFIPGRNDADTADFEPELFKLVQFTSGTTDVPRPVTVSRHALTANLDGLGQRLCMSSNDSIFSWLPLNHDMGLVGAVLLADHLGCALTVCPPETFLGRPSLWARWLAEARPTCLPAPNGAWSLLLRRAGGHDRTAMQRALTTLRLPVIGGEPIDPGLCGSLLESLLPGRAMIPAYGLAEATLAVTVEHPGCDLVTETLPDGRQVVSPGIPLDGVSVTVRDDGEIMVKGSSLADEYASEPDGLATGDLGHLSGSRLYVTGRRKDLIKIHGRRIFPHEIERSAESTGFVRPGRTVAFSLPGPPAEHVVLLAEPNASAPGDLVAALRLAVLEDLGVKLDHVDVVEPGTIPKTTSGKLRRGAARDMWKAAV